MSQTDINARGDIATDRVQPVSAQPAARLIGLDFTRGIAVLGILAANIVAFGQPFNAYMWPAQFQTGHGPVSDWMWVVQFVLIDGKMRGLFTLLFGAGLVLFMDKAWAKGATRWLQARRLFWLLIFGLIHFYLIWRGDILILYAVAGFFAMLCLRWSAKTLMAVGITGYVLGALLFAGGMGMSWAVADTSLGNSEQMAPMRADLASEVDKVIADDTAETALIQSGEYRAFVEHNFAEHGGDPLFSMLLFGFETWPLMLIGMALFNIGMFNGGLDPAGQPLACAGAGFGATAALICPALLGVMLRSESGPGVMEMADQNGATPWGFLAACLRRATCRLRQCMPRACWRWSISLFCFHEYRRNPQYFFPLLASSSPSLARHAYFPAHHPRADCHQRRDSGLGNLDFGHAGGGPLDFAH